MTTTVERTPWRIDLAASARWLAAGVLAGVVAGGLVGGVGGRVAMLVLRFTSAPSVVGLTSDDGFEIGVLSPATVFLVGLTSLLGVVGALAYLAARPWIPLRLRPPVAAAAFAIVGGANVVHADGIDFRVLTPPGLAVGLFVAIPALYGWTLAVLAERWLAGQTRTAWWYAGLLPLGALLLGSEAGLAVIAVAGLVWFVCRATPSVAAAWSSPPVAWLGRIALAAFVARALVELVGEAAEVLL